jgi:major membrane immunogen (membrane-anchored lipoprotein)
MFCAKHIGGTAMKKVSELALIAILGITLTTGCTGQPSKVDAAKPIILKDGTYTAAANGENRTWVPEMTITVSGGKISDLKFDESTAMKKSEDIEYQNSFKAQMDIDLLGVYASLQNILVKTQDITKLDTVAGATKTAENFKALAAEALKDAKDGEKYKDGSYTAKGIMDERFWTPTVAITVKDSKIATVKYDEVSARIFKYKSLDAAYIARFKSLKKVDLAVAYDLLEKSLLEKQDPSKIDSVTGATSTSNSFIEIAKKVIEKAY